MKKSTLASVVATAGLLATAVGLSPAAVAASPQADTHRLHPVRACRAVAARDEATCHAMVMVDSRGAYPQSSTPPGTGVTPVQLRDAYKLGSSSSGGRTVAIVDAYGYPNLERDLGVYRSQFHLPSCTVASGCLRIVDQYGGRNYPRMDTGWAQEQALDVDAVSAACPDCTIVVVQARSASFADLGTAVNTAAGQGGVVAISNSYGGSDLPDATYGSYYRHPGIAVTASTGDDGYQGGSYPASSAYVTAVGGTSLSAAAGTSRGWAETAWSGAGSGCSSYNAAVAPSTFGTGCSNRAMADVAAAADPGRGGLAVYYPTSSRRSTWGQIGGTSEASPIVASVYAMSGNTAGYANAIPYGHAGALFDVTGGSNGTCPTTQWCTARPGWDGPTGLGTPNGTGGF